MPGFQLVRPKTRAMSAPTITTPGSRSSVRLSLIIATYNRADYLPRTLNSLTNQSLGSELFEIIVVNNNSTDHTAEVCRSFAEAQPELNFTMVTEIRQGLSHARNCGINHAKGDYFAIIDDDELVNRDFLKSYYDFFGMYPTAAACGGVVTPLYEFPGKRSFPFRNTPIPAAGIWVSGARPSNVTGCSIRNWDVPATLRWAARRRTCSLGCGPEGKRSTMCRVQSSITSSRNKS